MALERAGGFPLGAKNRILAGVLDVLAHRGVDKLSIRTVAQAAGVSAAQVQYYFRTKRDLIQAGFHYSSEQLLEAIAEAQPQTLGELVLQWFPLDETRERRVRVWVAYTEIATRDEQLAHEAARIEAELRAWFVEIGVPSQQAEQLLALIDGATVQCLVVPMQERQERVENIVLAFLDQNHLNRSLNTARRRTPQAQAPN